VQTVAFNGTSYTMTLGTTGGTGSGLVTYTVIPGGSATGCAISGNTLTATTSGTCFVTATKAGDGNYNSTTSAQVTETFTGAATGGTTSLDLASKISGPIVVGSSDTYAAHVKATSGHGPLTGTVTFYVNGVAVPGCSNLPLNSGGVAQCEIHFPNAGTSTVTATYANDSHYAGSTNSSTQVVTKGTTSLNLSHSAPVIVGSSVTYNATVSETSGSGPLTGKVSFTDNGVAISGCQNLTLVGATANCTVHFTSSGSFTIAATYANDANFSGSSNSVVQTVNAGAKPTFTSENSAEATVGHFFSFHVTATGSPTFTISGALPTGVTFNSSTGVLSGTPANGTKGKYTLTISATNSYGTTTQTFTLEVSAH
jgi:hypothetical protein